MAETLETAPNTDIIYLDESGIHEHLSRNYGRSICGTRVKLPTSGRRYKRLNIVAGYRNGQMLCPFWYGENTDSRVFCEWFEWVLCPILKDGSVIVMDNASFHPKERCNKIAQSYGYRILWLPPYSPDKNPIEKQWACMKNWLRLYSSNYLLIQRALLAYFQKE